MKWNKWNIMKMKLHHILMMERRRKKNIMLKTYLMINKIFYHKEKLEKTVRVKIKKKKNIVMKNKTIKRRKNQIN